MAVVENRYNIEMPKTSYRVDPTVGTAASRDDIRQTAIAYLAPQIVEKIDDGRRYQIVIKWEESPLEDKDGNEYAALVTGTAWISIALLEDAKPGDLLMLKTYMSGMNVTPGDIFFLGNPELKRRCQAINQDYAIFLGAGDH